MRLVKALTNILILNIPTGFTFRLDDIHGLLCEIADEALLVR